MKKNSSSVAFWKNQIFFQKFRSVKNFKNSFQLKWRLFMSAKRAYIKLFYITSTLGTISHFPFFPAKTMVLGSQHWAGLLKNFAFLEDTLSLTKKIQYDFWESPTTYLTDVDLKYILPVNGLFPFFWSKLASNMSSSESKLR